MSTVLAPPSIIPSSLHKKPKFLHEYTSCIVLNNPPQHENQAIQKKHSDSESITNQHKTITLEQENCISKSKLKYLKKMIFSYIDSLTLLQTSH